MKRIPHVDTSFTVVTSRTTFVRAFATSKRAPLGQRRRVGTVVLNFERWAPQSLTCAPEKCATGVAGERRGCWLGVDGSRSRAGRREELGAGVDGNEGIDAGVDGWESVAKFSRCTWCRWIFTPLVPLQSFPQSGHGVGTAMDVLWGEPSIFHSTRRFA